MGDVASLLRAGIGGRPWAGGHAHAYVDRPFSTLKNSLPKALPASQIARMGRAKMMRVNGARSYHT